MPATLYTLVGRKHHTEPSDLSAAPTPAVTADHVENVQINLAAEVLTEEKAESVVDTVSTEPVVSEQPDSSDVSSSDQTPAEVFPAWDASWSKSQLLAVAQSLNLAVTSASTKNEIISALSAAAKT